MGDLSENRLSKGLEVLKDCTNIRNLSLNNNKFKDLDAVEPLKDLEFLSHLDILEGNEFEDKDIRSKIFKLLPKLIFLDGVDKDGNEAKSEEEDEEGDEEELDEDDEADYDGEGAGEESSDDDIGDDDEEEGE